MKIRTLIVDDHPLLRKGLQACLARKDRLKVVGEACDGDEALRKTRELSPDIVLMDISMPGMDGLVVTELLRKEAPNVKVLILSMHTHKEYIFRIIQAGAHGYLSKEARPDELVHAIESVYDGQPFFSPEIASATLERLVSQKEPFVQLSAREREVLALVSEGLSNKKIAQRLRIGVRTIQTYRERIMEKLDIHTVAGLTRYALLNGIVSLERPHDALRR